MTQFHFLVYGILVCVLSVCLFVRHKTQVAQLQQKPEPGETWRLKAAEGDPWGIKEGDGVTILDVKNGWVRYSFGPVIFKDERMEMETFVYCYAPEK
jgi:hypothetical protein